MFPPSSGPLLRQLLGTVGPGFDITLAQPDGTLVTQIDPGTYDITVRDLSTEHNFHITGPGVNQLTQVETTDTVTWTVALQDGRYTIFCDPHSTSDAPDDHGGHSAAAAANAEAAAQAAGDRGAEGHDLAEERERCGVEDRQGR